ncbi:MAG: TonB-dependent receptor [Bacteroidales bacterium]|nr:TonB-dependent receptor [Bacteroidales bacterium]
MKLIAILVCTAGLAGSYASSVYSQETKLNLNVKNMAVKDVLKQVEDKSEFTFMYNASKVNVYREVNLNVENSSIEDILQKIFSGDNVSYKIIDRNIILSTIQKEIEIGEQTRTVSGKITNAKGESLPGVTVVVKGTTLGSMTDINGNYTFANIPSDATLQYSFVGMKTQEVKFTGETTINIVMQDDIVGIGEVVVVGYGTQKKVNLTGAVEQVTSEVFQNRSVSNATQALQGVVPNLNIKLSDGKPTRSSSFNIRGTTSIGQGGSALVLIDGVEGDPALLNPEDIASVSVLKDAASASIYGARGSFGVVLITTKDPVKGKTTINYTTNFSVQAPTETPDYVHDGVIWAEHFRDAYYNYYNYLPTSINNSFQVYSNEWLESFKNRKAQGINDEVVTNDNGSYTYYGNTDWYDLLYKDHTLGQDHNITVSGGTEKSDFYISGRYYNTGGLYNFNPDDYKALNLRVKGSLEVLKWLRMGNNMEFSNTDYHSPFVPSYAYNIQRYIELAAFPSMPVFNPDGSYTRSAAYTIGSFMDKRNAQDTNNKQLKNTVNFSSKFLNDKLRINGDFTFRYKTYLNDRKRVKVPFSEKQNVFSYCGTFNDFTETNANTLYTATNLYAEYENTFKGSHFLKGMIGYNYETSRYKELVAQRNGLLLDDAESINLALGESISTTANVSNWDISGMFFRLNYNYKERYLLELNGRYDGSSKFPSRQQWGFFPSISAGWRLSQEPFWKVNEKIMSNVKIRASYGSLGNGNIDPYRFMELLTISTSTNVLNGALNKYTSAPAVIPKNLTWETATTTDLGLDFAMINGKLRFSGDLYVRKTTDMYTVGVTLPDVFGADSPKGNYADMTTKGWEISLSYEDNFLMADKPFNWEIQASMYDYTSKIDRYNNSTKSLSDYYEGMTIGEMWGYKTDGLFQTTTDLADYTNTIVKASNNGSWKAGDVKFRDLNGNDKIDYGDNTVSNPGDKVVLGNSEPRYIYNLTAKGDWNNFFFSVFFQGVVRQYWYPSAESSFWGQYNRPYNSLPYWHLNNYWTEDNPNAYLPRYSTYNGTLGWSSVKTDRYLQNVAYLRLKNLQVGYTIPRSVTSKINISNARIYLSGENIWCWSPLYEHTKDFDVATATTGTDSDLSTNAMGDGNNYPLMKSYILGLSITF